MLYNIHKYSRTKHIYGRLLNETWMISQSYSTKHPYGGFLKCGYPQIIPVIRPLSSIETHVFGVPHILGIPHIYIYIYNIQSL